MSYINMDKRFKISKILIDNYIFILLMLVIATHKGSNAFGYDSAASCSPNGKLSRRGRAQMLAAIPCDLARQPYCNLPGAAYPWHAVRRFVHENQGLMKRMYGDMRHISVLRDEIQNNEIDIEDIEMAAERYSRSGFRRSSKFMHQRNEDFSYGGSGNLKNNDIIMEPHFRPVATSTTRTTTPVTASTTTAKIPTDAMKATTESDSKKATTEKPTTKTPNLEGFTESNTNEIKEVTSNTEAEQLERLDVNDDRNLASNSVYELPTLTSNVFEAQQSTSGDNIEIIESPKLNIELNNLTASAAMISATLKATQKGTTTTLAPTTTTTKTALPLNEKVQTNPTSSTLLTSSSSAAAAATSSTTTTTKRIPATPDIYHRRRPQYPYRQRPKPQQQLTSTQQPPQKLLSSTKSSQAVNESERIPNTPPSPTITTTSSLLTASSASSTKSQIHFSNKDLNADVASSILSNANNSKPTANSTTTPNVFLATSSTSTTLIKPKIELLSGEKFRRQPITPSNKPNPTTSSVPNTSGTRPPVLRDGQLFQDTVKQEPAPVVNLRGVNACPVKEEVVAPFWANNTRGEVLALLNLYPFEQYVHWEKCTHEHKQMYCREGCRCEQQYRLHRLLAYDPRNECRGIFSDWFRFPSCCICKCYNVPMEFRATSRSPRMQSFPEDEVEPSIIQDTPDDIRHPLEIAEAEVKRAIYEHATEDWYRPRDYDENDDDDVDGEYWEV